MRALVLAWLVVFVAACGGGSGSAPSITEAALVPKPASVSAASGAFTLGVHTVIVHDEGDAELARLATSLAARLATATGFATTAVSAGAAPPRDRIVLTRAGTDAALGSEGYVLEVGTDEIVLRGEPAGVFHGVTTLRQLLPPAIEGSTVSEGPFRIGAGTIRDTPRFAWRGTMLDVARHFFDKDEVKRLVDRMAAYKLNRLHLHLSDDQGFRIAIDAWPDLATIGGSTEVGGGPGGFYTQADYAEIVAYAAERYVVVVPEIDVPAHSSAMMASYGVLTCDDVAVPLVTGTYATSSLCTSDPAVVAFLEAVIGEIAALTPGPWFHVGGDESIETPPAEYGPFLAQVKSIVEGTGKRMIGWEEVARASLGPSTLVQHWRDASLASEAAADGAKLILSPSNAAYLDMAYVAGFPIGTLWAGAVDVDRAYEWDPATLVPGVDESAIEGVEAALWTETVATEDDVEQLVFPRLLGVADIAWSRAADRGWSEYRARLAAHGPRLEAMGIDFYRSSVVEWEP